MAMEFRAPDWADYKMTYGEPHRELEPLDGEIALVDEALGVLRDAGVLPPARYDREEFAAFRAAVAERFEIPWTAITPRMQRLIWAINAIHQPAVMLAGIFCGNTFISNAGAAIGPGAVYEAKRLIGVEIKPHEAERAARNVRTLDGRGRAEVIADDAIHVVANLDDPIDLLYLDADGTPEQGKGVYLDILQAGFARMPAGSLILAHNSVNAAEKLRHYLAFVRDPANCRQSVNMIVDGEGLEVTVK